MSNFNYNAGTGVEYNKRVQRALNSLIKELRIELLRLKRLGLKGESLTSQLRISLNKLERKYSDVFDKLAKKEAKKLVETVESQSNFQIKSFMAIHDLEVKPFYKEDEFKGVLKSCVELATSEIKSIPTNYIDLIKKRTYDAVMYGNGYKDIFDMYSKISRASKRKVELLALDQNRKIHSAITVANFKRYDIKRFKWIHSGASNEPRKMHQKLNGKIFDMDKPPVIEIRNGMEIHGYPAQCINCKCLMVPII